MNMRLEDPQAPATPAQPANPGQLPANPMQPEKPAAPAQPGPEVPATPLMPAVPVSPPDDASTTSAFRADTGGVGLPLVGLLVLLALGLGVLVGMLLRHARKRREPGDPGGTAPAATPAAARPAPAGRPPVTTAALPPAGPSTAGPEEMARADAVASARAAVVRERSRGDDLAAALVEVRDRVDNPAVTEKIAAALERGGWFAIDPAGARFDPASHRAVDREPTDDPALHGTVASTERLGYQDAAGTVLRNPEVVVHAHDAASGRSAE